MTDQEYENLQDYVDGKLPVTRDILKYLIGENEELKNVNTSEVRDFSGLFFNKIVGEVSNWNTSRVETMEKCFCEAIFEDDIDLSKWDVSKVKTMEEMFNNIRVEKLRGLEKWNTESLVNMSRMFFSSDVRELNVSNFNTANLKKARAAFFCFNNIEDVEPVNLDLSKWDTSSLEEANCMFSSCNVNIDVSGWDLSVLVEGEDMFSGVNLEKSDISRFSLKNLENGDMMFSKAWFNSGAKLDFDLGNLKSGFKMFSFSNISKDIEEMLKNNAEDPLELNVKDIVAGTDYQHSTSWHRPLAYIGTMIVPKEDDLLDHLLETKIEKGFPIHKDEGLVDYLKENDFFYFHCKIEKEELLSGRDRNGYTGFSGSFLIDIFKDDCEGEWFSDRGVILNRIVDAREGKCELVYIEGKTSENGVVDGVDVKFPHIEVELSGLLYIKTGNLFVPLSRSERISPVSKMEEVPGVISKKSLYDVNYSRMTKKDKIVAALLKLLDL